MAELFKKHLFVNILCGGGGTRLWPRSRKKTPKQFINLFGEETLFQKTVKRSLWLTTSEKIFVATNADYLDEVIAQGKVISPRNVLPEPQAKNTAIAVGVAAVYIKKIDPEAVIVNFPSDPLIKGKQEFIKELLLAAEAAASEDFIVTLGIKPTFPHTGLGYIEADKTSINFSGGKAFKVASFREKPDLPQAQKFLKEGNFYWNAGIYIWKVATILSAFEKYAPEMAKLLQKLDGAIGSQREAKVLSEIYEKVESVSVDFAISEKAKNLLLVPATFYWNDVGDYKVIYDLSQKDESQNYFVVNGKKGEIFAVETKNCLVQTEDRLVGTVGVENLIIVDTPDALLVCRKDAAEDVKKLVNLLKEKEKKEYL